MKTDLILASASPRRRQMLENLGVPFRLLPTNTDESHGDLEPHTLVTELAARKAAAAMASLSPEEQNRALIIACDTVVVLDGSILEKPRSEEEAFAMLSALSGRQHEVCSGLVLKSRDKEIRECIRTKVTFRPLTESEILAYIRTGEPMDKAGAYGIQGLASAFVFGIEGDYMTIVGMPLCRLIQRLREEFSLDLLAYLPKGQN